ncbi:hypothetical protein ABVK25_006553 [Lepraria finkii]|uniref:Uncharacterized protein n=1 Tax=Lepraria finkii TaxID=1340010 RepID=A0ABR4BBJ2_9LECA
MGTELRTYGSKQNGLVMRPGKDTTWGMFSSALMVLLAFNEEHDPMSLIFDVTDLEYGYVEQQNIGNKALLFDKLGFTIRQFKTIHIAHQIPLFAITLAVTVPATKPAQLLSILPPTPMQFHPPTQCQFLTALLHFKVTLLQANQTISTPNHLPAGPFFIETVTGGSVKFFNYRAYLTAGDGFAAIVEAQRDCIMHMQVPNNPKTRIGGPLKICSAGTVTLRLIPLTIMTWVM